MYFWKDKEGRKLSFGEFMRRFKEGVSGITPLQQTNMQMKSMWIITIGLVCGLVISFYNLKSLWWLSIILFGGLFNTSVQMIGIYQKKLALVKVEELASKFEEEINDN